MGKKSHWSISSLHSYARVKTRRTKGRGRRRRDDDELDEYRKSKIILSRDGVEELETVTPHELKMNTDDQNLNKTFNDIVRYVFKNISEEEDDLP